MAWDLRQALLKKEEKESARLADFEFRLRARTMRLLAPLIDEALDPAELVREIALLPDNAIIEDLAVRFPAAAPNLAGHYEQSRRIARAELVAERGDPSPYRLA